MPFWEVLGLGMHMVIYKYNLRVPITPPRRVTPREVTKSLKSQKIWQRDSVQSLKVCRPASIGSEEYKFHSWADGTTMAGRGLSLLNIHDDTHTVALTMSVKGSCFSAVVHKWTIKQQHLGLSLFQLLSRIAYIPCP